MSYDPDNIFAKILRAEIPSHKVYEDEHTYALMDIMPRADGHVLVIPKTAARNLLDASAEQLAAVIATTQKVANATMQAYGATGVTVQQFNEDSGGQEIYHLHFHILPRHDGVALRPPGVMADHAVLADLAAKLRAVLDA